MTNREYFDKFMRAEIKKKLDWWSNLSNEDLILYTTGKYRDASIRFEVGAELCGFKLDHTKELSVGSGEDVIKWLEEEAVLED